MIAFLFETVGQARAVGLRAVIVVLAAASSAAAQDLDAFLPAAGGWETYMNSRFGMSFDYPAEIFVPEAQPTNGDGRTFRADDASLQIYAFQNIENETPASLERRLVGAEGYENVTYSPSGSGWLVLSGFRGDTIFYEKYLFRGGIIAAFGTEFPTVRKPFYAPIVERIEDSFRAERSG